MVVTPHSILMLCTGNLCRSPYVERRLRHQLPDVAVEVSSAGTRAAVGAPMEPAAIAALEARGGSAEGFLARQVTSELIDRAGLVLCATRDHRAAAVRLAPRALAKTFALADFSDLVTPLSAAELPRSPFEEHQDSPLARLVRAAARERGTVQPRSDESAAVIDPIGRSEQVFGQMADQVEALLPPVVRVLRQHLPPR